MSDPTPAGAAPRDEAREIERMFCAALLPEGPDVINRVTTRFNEMRALAEPYCEKHPFGGCQCAALAAAPRADPAEPSAAKLKEIANDVVQDWYCEYRRAVRLEDEVAILRAGLDSRKAAPPCDDAALCSTPAVAAGPLGASLGVGGPESCWSRASHNAEDSPTAQEASARETLGRKLYEHYGNSAIEWRYRSEAHHEAWRQDAADILAALKIATGEAVLAGARKP